MKGRIKEDDSSVQRSTARGRITGRFRPKHEDGGGNIPLLCRRPSNKAFDGDASVEQLLLDGDAEAKGLDYYDIRRFAPFARPQSSSPGRSMTRVGGLHVAHPDLATGQTLDESIADTYGEFVWSEIQRALLGEPRRECAAGRRASPQDRLGRRYARSTRKKTRASSSGVERANLRNSSSSPPTTTPRGSGASSPPTPKSAAEAGPPRAERGVDYAVEDFDGRFWIKTNSDGAIDFAIASTPYDATERKNWKIEIPHTPAC